MSSLNGNDTKPPKNKGGRPAFEFTPQQIEMVGTMALAGCSNKEIAAYCQCSEDTLERRLGGFAGELPKKRAERKFSLRWAQFEAAMGGNPTMLIFLGKQELGQSDAIPDIPWDSLDADDLRQIEQGVLPFKLRKRA